MKETSTYQNVSWEQKLLIRASTKASLFNPKSSKQNKLTVTVTSGKCCNQKYGQKCFLYDIHAKIYTTTQLYLTHNPI